MKRGKPRSRSGKIAFWGVLVAGVGVVTALFFPEVRVWLHLQNRAPAAVVSSPSKSTPIEQPKPSSNIVQHSNSTVKGNRNVAGNNIAGSDNVVGDNNQVTASAPPIAIAPNGIANAAPNFGVQSVITDRPPLPNVTFSTENLAAEANKKPGVMLHVRADAAFPTPAFSALCDHPCTSVQASFPTGFTGSTSGSSKSDPDLIAVRIDLPGVQYATDVLNWEVRSNDDQEISVIHVEAIRQW